MILFGANSILPSPVFLSATFHYVQRKRAVLLAPFQNDTPRLSRSYEILWVTNFWPRISHIFRLVLSIYL